MKSIKSNIRKLDIEELESLRDYIDKRIDTLRITQQFKKQKVIFNSIENIHYEYNIVDYIHEINCSCDIDGIHFHIYCHDNREMIDPIISIDEIELIRYYGGEIVFEDDDVNIDELLKPLEKYKLTTNKLLQEIHRVFQIIYNYS